MSVQKANDGASTIESPSINELRSRNRVSVFRAAVHEEVIGEEKRMIKEAQKWIEAVTQTTFPSSFSSSLRNGVLLCLMINAIKPNTIKRIHRQAKSSTNNTAFQPLSFKFAEMENISMFLKACKQLGLSETLLFSPTDLHEGKAIAKVAVTLYWLARVARARGFTGPQLNVSAFVQTMKCAKCNQAIDASSNFIITNIDQQYHIQCYTCSKCNTTLDERYKQKVTSAKTELSTETKEDLTKKEKQEIEAKRLEQERLEKERLEKERLEKERLETERLKKEKRLEQERLEKERLEKERLEKERLEQERLEKQKLEKERLEKEQLEKEEQERQRKAQLEKERLDQERLDQERLEQERLEKERLEQEERLEKERLEKERLEKERLEQERLEKERLEKERLKQEKLEKEKADKKQNDIQITFYPEKSGFLFTSKGHSSTKWKKNWVELKEGKLSIYNAKKEKEGGRKLVLSLPAEQCAVAGLVKPENNKSTPFIILQSNPTLKFCVNKKKKSDPAEDEQQLKELQDWAGKICRNNRMHVYRSRRAGIKQTNRLSNGKAYGREISKAISQNQVANNLYNAPSRTHCYNCMRFAPTWTDAKGRQLCLACFDVVQSDPNNDDDPVISIPTRYRSKTALDSPKKSKKNAKEQDTAVISSQEKMARRILLEKRREKILKQSIAKSELGELDKGSNNKIVQRMSRLITTITEIGHATEDCFTEFELESDSDDESNNIFDNKDNNNSNSDNRDSLVPSISVSDCSEEDFSTRSSLSSSSLAPKLKTAASMRQFNRNDSSGVFGAYDMALAGMEIYREKSSPFAARVKSKLSPTNNSSWRYSTDDSDVSYSEDSFDSLLATQDNTQKPSKTKIKEGDWNQRFQEVMQQLSTVCSNTPEEEQINANLALIGLAHDFVYSARSYGKIIISEVYLDHSLKTIKPVAIGGVAGGSKYLVHNILFKFALDNDGIYGNDDAKAITAGGHELKGLQAYFNCNISELCLPLMALVDYRGFRVIAISKLPINKSTIVYGSNDGGVTIHSNTKFNKIMKQAASILNVKEHPAGLDPTKRKEVFSAADIEGHIGLVCRHLALWALL